MVATVPVETPPAPLCPKCGKELPAGAKQCPEHRNWIGWLKQLPEAVKYLVTTTAGVIGIVVVILNWHSRTEIATVGIASKNPSLIAVTINNVGKAATRDVLVEFTLAASQPKIVEFGTLTNLSPAADRTIPKGGNTILHFDIDHIYIRSPHDVRGDAFWRKYRNMPFRISGEAIESNGKVR